MYIKNTKGQITLFLLISVVIIVAFVLIMLLNDSDDEDFNKVENGVLSNLDKDAIDTYVEDKMTLLIEAAIISGETDDKETLMAYLNEDMKVLRVLNLDQFADRVHSMETADDSLEYTAYITDNEEFIIFEMTYPIVIEMADSSMSLKTFRVKVPLRRAMTIPT